MPRKQTDAVHRQITRDDVEASFDTLFSRLIKANRRCEDNEARLLYIAGRCVKTVLDLLKLPADSELLRQWKVKGYDLGPVVEDRNREMVASNNGRNKVLDNIAKTHEIWRKAVREFGGIA